ncbi:MAG TPA: glycosyltransferase family 39 protein [Verrucomicrobiae bacterium]|nr:glycosyltransferase family 39 protein [Verrucomicrobiae bacterium]
MKLAERHRCAICLVVFASAFVGLTVGSYVRESATWDEPQHVVAGYNALRFGDYRTDPEHPPLIRMWAALPLLGMNGIRVDLGKIDASEPGPWVREGQFYFCHETLYLHNDADRLLYAARFMIVLLGVLLGVLLFAWTRELFGFWPAAAVLGLYTVEPNILAHSRLVTTDLGVTCFFFGTMYFLWRTARRVSVGNVAGLVVFFAVAQISKFSALLLCPVVVVLLAARVCRRAEWPGRVAGNGPFRGLGEKSAVAAGIVVAMAVVAWGGIWAVYGFRYAPSASRTWRMDFHNDPLTRQRLPVLAKAVGWVDGHRLAPNAYSEGFLAGQTAAQGRGAFLMGMYRSDGWWWYFPFAFVVKSPVSLLAIFVSGAVVAAMRWRRWLDDTVYLLVPVAAYLGVAMTSKLNIGERHILPIHPFVLVFAGFGLAELWGRQNWRGHVATATVCGLAAIEVGMVCPHYLAFFNVAAGGPLQGQKYLVDSNIDWGQDLKGLKQWMEKRGIEHINLSYFGTADPAYYQIHCTYLGGGPWFDQPLVDDPELPGYVAVSVTNLRGVHFPVDLRDSYKALLAMRPEAVIGYSMYVYRVERPWWP